MHQPLVSIGLTRPLHALQWEVAVRHGAWGAQRSYFPDSNEADRRFPEEVIVMTRTQTRSVVAVLAAMGWLTVAPALAGEPERGFVGDSVQLVYRAPSARDLDIDAGAKIRTLQLDNYQNDSDTHLVWGCRRWGWGGYCRPWGWGYYRPWGWGGYCRPWGWGYYRPWGWSGYCGPYATYYYAPYYGFVPGYYYYWGCAADESDLTVPLQTLAIKLRTVSSESNGMAALPPSPYRGVIEPRTTRDATAPPTGYLLEPRTYPYDGGPRDPVPMPQGEPKVKPAPPTVPLEGRVVSVPARQPSKFVYRAYGEKDDDSISAERDRLAKSK
jgi:hypothetical protein